MSLVSIGVVLLFDSIPVLDIGGETGKTGVVISMGVGSVVDGGGFGLIGIATFLIALTGLLPTLLTEDAGPKFVTDDAITVELVG